MSITPGVQLYICRKEYFEKNINTVLNTISDLGYDGLEGLPCYYENFKGILDQTGLTFYGPHIVPGELKEESKVLKYCQAMGGTEVVSSGPLDWDSRTEDDFRKTCGLLNSEGGKLRKEGIHLHYHNHEFEFKSCTDSDMRPIDILLKHLDPECCTLAFDTGWPVHAGTDPVQFIKDNAGMIGIIHLRDFQGETSCPLGQGEHDVKAVLEAALQLPDLRKLVIEQDPSETPLNDIGTSIHYFSSNIT